MDILWAFCVYQSTPVSNCCIKVLVIYRKIPTLSGYFLYLYTMTTRNRTQLIFFQSLIAMLGSLYYSYFGDPILNIQTGALFSLSNWLVPCDLCRWARILMYPIVFISGVALLEKSTKYALTVLIMSKLGLFLELYHYLLQKVNISTSFTCTFANPCNALEVNYFGFVTIPFLCLIAFLIITIAARKVHLWNKRNNS